MQIVVIFDSDGHNESPEDLITILGLNTSAAG
jgi:hypothetical protein